MNLMHKKSTPGGALILSKIMVALRGVIHKEV